MLDAFWHAPVLVHDDHFCAHEAAGGVLIIFKQVDDVSGLLHIVDMGQDLVALFLVELLDDVDGIVCVEVVDLFGDLLGRHVVEQLEPVILVKFHKDIGCGVLVEELEQEFGLIQLQFLVELGYVGRV